MNEYQQSLKIQRDNYSAMKASNNEARDEGRKQERAKALAEKKEIALKLKNKSMLIDEISELTGLSIEEIASL